VLACKKQTLTYREGDVEPCKTLVSIEGCRLR